MNRMIQGEKVSIPNQMKMITTLNSSTPKRPTCITKMNGMRWIVYTHHTKWRGIEREITYSMLVFSTHNRLFKADLWLLHRNAHVLISISTSLFLLLNVYSGYVQFVRQEKRSRNNNNNKKTTPTNSKSWIHAKSKRNK